MGEQKKYDLEDCHVPPCEYRDAAYPDTDVPVLLRIAHRDFALRRVPIGTLRAVHPPTFPMSRREGLFIVQNYDVDGTRHVENAFVDCSSSFCVRIRYGALFESWELGKSALPDTPCEFEKAASLRAAAPASPTPPSIPIGRASKPLPCTFSLHSSHFTAGRSAVLIPALL